MSFSIVIPVFNSSSKLNKCIDSVIAQLSDNDEIIIINDGSTDDSENICKEYIDKYTQIKYLYKQNGGVSSARNLGIQESSNDWIIFLDSDDELLYNFLKNLRDIIEVDDYDWIMWSSLVVNDTDNLPFIKFDNLVVDKNDFFKFYNLIPYMGMVWAKAYKRTLLKNDGISFRKYLDWGEDTVFNIDYYEAINLKICTISKEGYKYTNSGQGLSKKLLSFEYSLNLFSIINEKLTVLPISELSKSEIRQFYFAPLFHSIYADNRFSLIQQIVNNYKKILKIKDLGFSNSMNAFFRNSLSFKRHFFILLYFNHYKIFNLIYTLLSKRW